MTNLEEFVFIIPARKNSKGIKNKNLIYYKKKNLIEHTFKILNSINKKNKFVITDCEKVKKIASKYSINIDYKRPKKLSGDKIELVDNLIHFDNYLSKYYNFKYYVILQPTSPLRTKSNLFQSLQIFKKRGYDSLFSASPSIEHPSDSFYLNKKKIKYFIKKKNSLRQSYNKSYFINGAIYIFKKTLLKKKKIISRRHGIYVMKKINSLDIDDYQDLDLFKKFID
ncbi:MAG: hypothetical protein VX087_01600 [Pseudomonadota bacterium]|nr:hypothetical protein [Pseudomonadota bacterium]